jgi:hypothetical protein
MQLEDLDWRASEILVRGKGDRHDRLPLPVDVGQALVSYLQRRGPSEFRVVFLRMHAPAGALTRRGVCGVGVPCQAVNSSLSGSLAPRWVLACARCRRVQSGRHGRPWLADVVAFERVAVEKLAFPEVAAVNFC